MLGVISPNLPKERFVHSRGKVPQVLESEREKKAFRFVQQNMGERRRGTQRTVVIYLGANDN